MPTSCITSSIRGKRICRTSSWPGCARWALRSRPRVRSIFRMTWWRFRLVARAEMGYKLTEEEMRKPYVEVSGRKGQGVKADDLLDELESAARAEVDSRHAEAPEAERAHIAHAIAIGALRYFLLKFTRTAIIAFDFRDALSFEGETGPYCQYAAVRARNIFRKAAEQQPDFSLAQLDAADR